MKYTLAPRQRATAASGVLSEGMGVVRATVPGPSHKLGVLFFCPGL